MPQARPIPQHKHRSAWRVVSMTLLGTPLKSAVVRSLSSPEDERTSDADPFWGLQVTPSWAPPPFPASQSADMPSRLPASREAQARRWRNKMEGTWVPECQVEDSSPPAQISGCHTRKESACLLSGHCILESLLEQAELP